MKINRLLWVFLLSGCSAAGAGTKKNGTGTTPGGTGGGAGNGSIIGIPGGPTNIVTDGPDILTTRACTTACTDFASSPILDTTGPTSVPGNAAMLFGAADNFGSAGPCVIEPELSTATTPGTLFPANWLRPRFRFTPLPSETLWEIRLHADREANDLVVYTTSTTWTLPRDIWQAMGKSLFDEAITVTIRGVNAQSPGMPSGSRGTFTIAPINAGGTLVYWATNSSAVGPTTSKLVGFRVGDESVIDALTVPEEQMTNILNQNGRDIRGTYEQAFGVLPGHVECIGCHVSTPDGDAVGFTDHYPWNQVFGSVEQQSVGAPPAYLSAGARVLLNQPWLGMMTVSKAHWALGDRRLITSYAARDVQIGFTATPALLTGDKLAWFDLETPAAIPFAIVNSSNDSNATNAAIRAAQGSAWGFLALTGETRSAVTPNWSHDGALVAYTSSDRTQDGRLGDNSETDIHVVPYNGGQGGQVAPLAGASTAGVSEYYPAFSADDKLVAFNRAAATTGKIYYRPDAEVAVVPAEGGTVTTLAANDPPACSGESSPGIINSWAKWSPTVFETNGKTYYFLIFSSARKYPGAFLVPPNEFSPADTRASQLYMTVIVRDKTTSALSTYPAVYLWNQTPTTSNLTPAWDAFKIPQVPPPK